MKIGGAREGLFRLPTISPAARGHRVENKIHVCHYTNIPASVKRYMYLHYIGSAQTSSQRSYDTVSTCAGGFADCVHGLVEVAQTSGVRDGRHGSGVVLTGPHT